MKVRRQEVTSEGELTLTDTGSGVSGRKRLVAQETKSVGEETLSETGSGVSR